MKIKKIIEIPFGGRSGTLTWEFGSDTVSISGIYPGLITENIIDINRETNDPEPYYMFILKAMYKELWKTIK